jgi:predicted TIM-barrel fold metal-dependent hydrolase
MKAQTVLEIPEMIDIPAATARTPQKAGSLPPGVRVISADSHWLEGDIWVDHYPASLKHRAPRMYFENDAWMTVIDGELSFPYSVQAAQTICHAFECVPGMTDAKARLRDLDTEGVQKELLFANRTIGIMRNTDLDLREYFFRGHNHGAATYCKTARDRLFFVAIPNFWNPSATRDSIAEIKELGASALLIPQSGQDSDGEQIYWSSDKMDPFWAAVEESGLPICFHIGEKLENNYPGAGGTGFLVSTQGFRGPWGQLTFGGVFDRHPALQVVFVEAGISWVAGMLHEADKTYYSFGDLIQPKLTHPPSYYWFNNCYATFMTDPPGLELLHRIGADRVMWSSDYPHLESTFGYTHQTLEAVFKATSVENAKMIVGATAERLFGMT